MTRETNLLQVLGMALHASQGYFQVLKAPNKRDKAMMLRDTPERSWLQCFSIDGVGAGCQAATRAEVIAGPRPLHGLQACNGDLVAWVRAFCTRGGRRVRLHHCRKSGINSDTPKVDLIS